MRLSVQTCNMYFVRGFAPLGDLPERIVAALVLACLLLCVSGEAKAASGSYIDFGAYDTQSALAAGTERGIAFKNGAPRLARGRTKGTLTSRVYDSAHKDTFIPSWNARTPSGTWLQVEMRVRSGGSWTRWWDMGVWAKGTDTVKRHSVNGQRAGDWRVLTDTLQSIGPLYADAYQYRLTLLSKRTGRTPRVTAIYMTASNSYRNGEVLVGANETLWGKDLSVPARSQMIYPNGGEVWCSPTSLSMVMAYWLNKGGRRSLNQEVPTVARHLRLRVPRERQLAFQHGLRRLLQSKDLGQPLLLTRTGRAVDRERGACHREHILGERKTYRRAHPSELGPPARDPGFHRSGERDRQRSRS